MQIITTRTTEYEYNEDGQVVKVTDVLVEEEVHNSTPVPIDPAAIMYK